MKLESALAAVVVILASGCGGGGNGGTGGGSGGSGGGTGGGSGGGTAACDTISVTSPWTIFPNTDGGANPTVSAASGSVKSCTESGKSRVVLNVTLTAPGGSPSANRAYGAHVHVAACDAGQAGGHYRNDPDAGASATNEIWLDFTTSGSGQGTSDHTATWLIRTGQAKAVVIHDHTSDDAGVAGPKLVCIDVPF